MRGSFFPPEILAYMTAHGAPELPVMAALRVRTTALGGEARMQIDAYQGQMMAWLLRAFGARRVLEIGTFTGMSALWMASALPDDWELHCCDVNAEWTAIAQEFWAKANLDQKIHLHLAPALETTAKFANAHFDAIFIDADKGNYPNYITEAYRLLRPGGLMMIDNTLWSGEVADSSVQDKITNTIRSVNDTVTADARWHSVMLPIGDGLTLAVKN